VKVDQVGAGANPPRGPRSCRRRADPGCGRRQGREPDTEHLNRLL